MKQFRVVFATILLLCLVTNSCSQKSNRERSSILGIFIASTPCSEHTKPVPGIPLNADCELIKWNLTLYQNPSDKTPATFKLSCIYGMPKQGTRGFIDGGNKVELEGNWRIVNESPGIIYQLTDNKTKKAISFLKLNDKLLHLLDSDGRLMIGSAAWSYTLNRSSS